MKKLLLLLAIFCIISCSSVGKVVEPPIDLKQAVIEHYKKKSNDKVAYEVKGLSAIGKESGGFNVTAEYLFTASDKTSGEGVQLLVAQKGSDTQGNPHWTIYPTGQTEFEKTHR